MGVPLLKREPNTNYSRSFPLPYSLERMEGIPFFFLSSIYICLSISRNREIIHIRFLPGTPESNQTPITC